MKNLSRIVLFFWISLIFSCNHTGTKGGGNNCNGLPDAFNIVATPTTNTIDLTWDADSTNIGVYNIERSFNSSPFQLYVIAGGAAGPGVNSFSFRDSGVQMGGRYCYKIQPQHTNGTRGCFSNEVCTTFNTGQNQANLIVPLVAVNFTAKTVHFSVQNIGNATSGQHLTYVEINAVNASSRDKPQSQLSVSVPAIPPGFSWTPPAPIPFSRFSTRGINLNTLTAANVVVTADAKSYVNESDETDNVNNQDY